MSIKDIREKMGLTRLEFAEKFKISKRTLESWEYDHRVPPPHVAYMLERILELEETCDEYKKTISAMEDCLKRENRKIKTSETLQSQ